MRLARLALLLAAAACGDSTPPSRSTESTARITGTVVEKLDAAPYSYLRLKTESGERWAAVPVTSHIDAGDPATIVNGVALKAFEARPLGRKFDILVFGTLERH
jgi:hypothetical protein